MSATAEANRPPFAYVLLWFPKLSETFVVDEMLAMERLGHRPLIVARGHPDGEEVNARAAGLLGRTIWLTHLAWWRQLLIAARTCVRHPLRLGGCLRVIVPLRSRRALVNLWHGLLLADLARRRRLRYLHAHFAGDAGELAWVAARMADIPYGITVHAVDIYLNRFLCRKLHDAAIRVTVCDYNIGQIVERCPDLPSSSFLLKYAGIDLDEFRLAAPRPPRRARDILAVGRITPKKGFDVLVSAVAELRDEGRDVRCRIVGTGGPVITRKLEEQIDALGLAGSVELLGAQSPARVKDLMAEADVLAAPCTIAPWGDRDSMPVVLKEAMAMELPVVASDDFGIPELVTPEAGILVPRDDVRALADGLRKVLDLDPDARADIGRAGRSAVAKFSEEEGASILAAAVERVLAS